MNRSRFERLGIVQDIRTQQQRTTFHPQIFLNPRSCDIIQRDLNVFRRRMHMLTRFEVSGFKNLENISVDFGPFTCIAGPNSVGKSNLFDAIEFLSLLSTHSFLEACTLIRPTPQQRSDISSLFSEHVLEGRENLTLAAEMILPSQASDEFSQQVEPRHTFVRYEVEIAVQRGEPLSAGLQLRLVNEKLSPISKATETLHFPNSGSYVKHFIRGGLRLPPLSSIEDNGKTVVQIRTGSRGHPRKIAAENTQRTVLSATATAENPIILAAQAEMRSWRFVALEPSAMRAPDDIVESRPISSTGAHIPSSLFRQALQEGDGSSVMNRVRDAIGALVDIRDLRVIQDQARDTLELRARIGATPELPARSLSDGTLRFLALSAMKVSHDYFGMLCMEEPENGIHPSKIADMHGLLQGISEPTENSARQVIVNTHSPYFVQATSSDDILCAVGKSIPDGHGGVLRSVGFHPLPETWRTQGAPGSREAGARPVSRGEIAAFLENPKNWNTNE
jgi:hypothetical protein